MSKKSKSWILLLPEPPVKAIVAIAILGLILNSSDGPTIAYYLKELMGFILIGAVLFGIAVYRFKLLPLQYLKKKNYKLEEIDSMSGQDFEILVADIFRKLGYHCEVTKPTRDQGADIVLQLNDRRIVVQTKRQPPKLVTGPFKK